MDTQYMKLYLSSDEQEDFYQPRKVLHSFHKIIENEDVLIVEIDRSLNGQKYGYGAEDIKKLYLIDRFRETDFENLNHFPIHVFVLLPKKEGIDITSLSQLDIIAWARLYDNEKDAQVVLEKPPYPLIDFHFTPLYLSFKEQNGFSKPRKVLGGIHCVVNGTKMLNVEVDKPLLGQNKYDFDGKGIYTFYLESKRGDNLLDDLNTFPIDVNVLVPEKEEDYEINSPPPLKVIGEARLYNNESNAK